MFCVGVPEFNCESNLKSQGHFWIRHHHYGIRRSLSSHSSHEKSDVQAFLSQSIMSLQVGWTVQGAEWLRGQYTGDLEFQSLSHQKLKMSLVDPSSTPLSCLKQPIDYPLPVRIFSCYFCIILLLFERIASRLARAAKRFYSVKVLPGGCPQVMECLTARASWHSVLTYF